MTTTSKHLLRFRAYCTGWPELCLSVDTPPEGKAFRADIWATVRTLAEAQRPNAAEIVIHADSATTVAYMGNAADPRTFGVKFAGPPTAEQVRKDFHAAFTEPPPGCARCGGRLAYPGAAYCGAACSAQRSCGPRALNARGPVDTLQLLHEFCKAHGITISGSDNITVGNDEAGWLADCCLFGDTSEATILGPDEPVRDWESA